MSTKRNLFIHSSSKPSPSLLLQVNVFSKELPPDIEMKWNFFPHSLFLNFQSHSSPKPKWWVTWTRHRFSVKKSSSDWQATNVSSLKKCKAPKKVSGNKIKLDGGHKNVKSNLFLSTFHFQGVDFISNVVTRRKKVSFSPMEKNISFPEDRSATRLRKLNCKIISRSIFLWVLKNPAKKFECHQWLGCFLDKPIFCCKVTIW